MKKLSFKIILFSLVILAASCSDDETPRPVATANPPAQIISSGETTSINLTSTIDGTTFSWTVISQGVTGASDGSGATIAQTLTVDNMNQGVASYTITPTANGIVGDAITVAVTVNEMLTTYNADIKPLLTGLCAPCHVAGGTHPSKWDEYNPTKNNISSIISRVKLNPGDRGFMPVNGAKLSDEQIALLEKWMVDGLLEK